MVAKVKSPFAQTPLAWDARLPACLPKVPFSASIEQQDWRDLLARRPRSCGPKIDAETTRIALAIAQDDFMLFRQEVPMMLNRSNLLDSTYYFEEFFWTLKISSNWHLY